MSETMSGEMPERMPEGMPGSMSESMSEDMTERMSDDMPERMSDSFQKIRGKKYQKMCQKKDPPSTTHPNDIMFIVPQMDNGNLFHVTCEGRVVNDELEQRASVFRRAARFWEIGDESRGSYEAEWGEPGLGLGELQ